MEGNYYNTNNNKRYKLYFSLLSRKVKEFNILPKNTYNIDKKGFILRVIRKTKRVFNKLLYKDY
jgi:hypothetical protein